MRIYDEHHIYLGANLIRSTTTIMFHHVAVREAFPENQASIGTWNA
jgi:hypothetical protein